MWDVVGGRDKLGLNDFGIWKECKRVEGFEATARYFNRLFPSLLQDLYEKLQ